MQVAFDQTASDFTLEKMVALGLEQHAEKISEISGAASNELSIEQVTAPPPTQMASLIRHPHEVLSHTVYHGLSDTIYHVHWLIP